MLPLRVQLFHTFQTLVVSQQKTHNYGVLFQANFFGREFSAPVDASGSICALGL